MVAKFWRNRRAAIAAEYVIILALLATGISVSIFTLADSIGGAFGNSSDIISTGVPITETSGNSSSPSSQTSSSGNCDNQGQGTGFGGGQGSGGGQGAGQGAGNTC
jgi:Flp pilus assembly pilin Flp